MNKYRKVISFEFDSEKYKAKDFVSCIASAVDFYSGFAECCKDGEIKNILSTALGFIDYNDYINRVDRNECIHEFLLNDFHENVYSIAKENWSNDFEMIKCVFNYIVRDVYYSEIPVSFKMTDVFEAQSMILDGESSLDLKRESIIKKLIIPVIKELDINQAHSVADIVRFCNINYVYGLFSKLGKSRYMKNLKVMKSFKRHYYNETDKFSEKAEGFWCICFREYNSAEMIFERYFQSGNISFLK